MKENKVPKVSIIIPTYNRAKMLSRAIKSVLNQTFQDFELIIVDDGSTDNTKEVVENFQKQDSRINYIWMKNSGRPAKPRNIGIKNSKGKYIAFLDSDDEWMPEKLEKQIILFENSNINKLGFVGCNILNIDTLKNFNKIYKMPRIRKLFKHLLIRNFLMTPSILVKKSVIEDVGLFDENFEVADDWDMWIRISQKYDFDFVDEVLVKRYIHTQSITQSSSIEKIIKEELYFINKYKSYYSIRAYMKRKEGLQNLYIKMARLHIKNNDIYAGREYFKKAITICPYLPKGYFNFFLSMFGAKFYKLIMKHKL